MTGTQRPLKIKYLIDEILLLNLGEIFTKGGNQIFHGQELIWKEFFCLNLNKRLGRLLEDLRFSALSLFCYIDNVKFL